MYQRCDDFTVSVERDWLMDKVLLSEEKSEAGVSFRKSSHEPLLKAIERYLPPQLALACGRSRIGSRTAAGSD